MNKFNLLSTNQLTNINGGRLKRKYRCALGVFGYGSLGALTGGALGALVRTSSAIREYC